VTPDDVDPDGHQQVSEEDEQVVRRLLTASADPVAMPPDVARRLDDVLADLVRADLEGRRTRRWPKVLVAAAAVSVLGLGVGNLVRGDGGAEMATSADAGAGDNQDRLAPSPESARSDGDGEAARERGDAVEQDADLRAVPGRDSGKRVPRLRAGSVDVDVQRIHDFAPELFAGSEPTQDSASPAEASCAVPEIGRRDRALAVRLDGEPATLVFRAARDGERRAEVYSCSDAASPVLVTAVDAR
jgi:hypothetical protein